MGDFPKEIFVTKHSQGMGSGYLNADATVGEAMSHGVTFADQETEIGVYQLVRIAIGRKKVTLEER